jgi:hypothetical protein
VTVRSRREVRTVATADEVRNGSNKEEMWDEQEGQCMLGISRVVNMMGRGEQVGVGTFTDDDDDDDDDELRSGRSTYMYIIRRNEAIMPSDRKKMRHFRAQPAATAV